LIWVLWIMTNCMTYEHIIFLLNITRLYTQTFVKIFWFTSHLFRVESIQQKKKIVILISPIRWLRRQGSLPVKLTGQHAWVLHYDRTQWDQESFYLCLSHPTASYFIQTLTTLNLYNNRIGVQGAQHLSDALRHNTVKQRVSSSSFTHPTVSYFTQTLTTLGLNFNQIGVQGAQHLSDTLRQNTVRPRVFLSLPFASNGFLFYTDTHYTQPLQ
jgi:hypothetical protein